MKLKSLISRLGGRIQSVQEETFDLFAQELPSHNLGFVDSKSPVLELSIAGRDLTIHQSPSVLASNRAGGTTGAVLWKITPAFAEWVSAPDNILFASGALSEGSAVIELGCGISPIVGLLLAPRVSHYVLTDQPYVARLVEQNLAANKDLLQGPGRAASRRRSRGTRAPERKPAAGTGRIAFVPVDWERDEVTPTLAGAVAARSFDAVIACDCIYNEALIDPLVQTCADTCRLRADDGSGSGGASPCVCVVAQQLRDHDVFEGWLVRFAESFDVWRVPDSCLPETLRSNSGFVVHIGILKGTVGLDQM
ncbi:hypothetical protein QBC33DRAFT_523530 [Phialemonium atrogriseum]|uniref:Diaminohydroxyphosphoribosylamino-pyrimidine deaminase n=1 Tax=Phialemonium atrogriseum TaxID=1093897 RepID=A0AAJ0C8C9_9PEZI|nr:uncharacterized protein QBC33DRAFT_523530 [Phialemonium atrogriseum]KAK1771377.1 hypothetical protein QBC33DRAFT_523530 [Phialemonium atrogriseum]